MQFFPRGALEFPITILKASFSENYTLNFFKYILSIRNKGESDCGI